MLLAGNNVTATVAQSDNARFFPEHQQNSRTLPDLINSRIFRLSRSVTYIHYIHETCVPAVHRC